MVFDARLGYDPDEWEECAEPEHFLVFAPFTRILLSAFAIVFAYYFFKLVNENKNKGSKEEVEEDAAPQQRVQSASNVDHVQKQAALDADELLREADQYLQQKSQDAGNSERGFTDAFKKFGDKLGQTSSKDDFNFVGQPITATDERFERTLSAVEDHLHEAFRRPELARQEIVDAVDSHQQKNEQPHQPQQQRQQQEEQFYQQQQQQQQQQPQQQQHQHQQQQQQPPWEEKPPVPGHQSRSEQHSPRPLPPLPSEFDVYGFPQEPFAVQQQQLQQTQPPPRRIQPQEQRPSNENRLSQDDRAMLEWEAEKARMEADRLTKLLDTEAGGESSTDLSSSAKAYAVLSPGSHISFNSQGSDKAQPFATPVASRQQQNVLVPQQTLTGSNRDSQLTDYDISDFHAHEPSNDGAQWQDAHFESKPLKSQPRRTTADSDDYVKVSEPIYDYPPKSDKPISVQEAAQLQELCQEYDLGLDLPGVAPPKAQDIHSPKVTKSAVDFVGPSGQPATNFDAFEQSLSAQQQQVRFQQQGQEPFKRQDSHQREQAHIPANIQTTLNQQKGQHGPQTHVQKPFQIHGRDDPRNIAAAELYVQDALEYLGNQDKNSNAGFVMEEEMLSSHGASNKKGQNRMHSGAGEATSHQVRTADVFERVEHDEHDDMTYAPEIQSVEIPPDQLSENSDNLLDYFDHVAAECDKMPEFTNMQQSTLKREQPFMAPKAETSASDLKPEPVGRAPQILPPFGGRVPSNSSLTSGRSGRSGRSPSGFSSDNYPYKLRHQSSVLSVLGVTSMQEMLLTITSLEQLSDAMRKAGLETTNMIFGIDYTASNKYQGEESFGGRSLHTIHPSVKNPYQQVITIFGRTLAPFASTGKIGVYGFGDARTGDWGTFPLRQNDCTTLEEVLKVYNEVTPTIALSGPTNFAPLIYQAMEICQRARDYHILVIIADGQVTNEKATRRAIVQACQHPLSIIVVGVGDGPWDMMRVFDESLPKRPWDNFHFVEFHEIVKRTRNLEEGDVKLAVQSLLEIPDQYRCVCELGLLDRSIPPRGSEIRRELMHNPL